MQACGVLTIFMLVRGGFCRSDACDVDAPIIHLCSSSRTLPWCVTVR